MAMLRYSLIFKDVVLPAPPLSWPGPLDLAVGLNEFLLIEGVGPEESEALLGVAATLLAPVQGQVWLWGQESAQLDREELYELRRRIAYVSPRQIFLERLTLQENLTLGPCYHQGESESQVLQEYAPLLERLALGPYLSLPPAQLPPHLYFRALWARELFKGPELILAILEESQRTMSTQEMIIALLNDYLAKRRSAVILMGRSLGAFHSLAHRLLRLRSGRLTAGRLLEARSRPLVDFFPWF